VIEAARIIDIPWVAREREADLLAELLRISRVTILSGEPGSGKTTLLKQGVLPLLRRRQTDRAAPAHRESQVVVPFADRRSRQARAVAEVAVYFDSWGEQPLAALEARLVESLPLGRNIPAGSRGSLHESLLARSREQRLRFLIIFDGFEHYLAADRESAAMREFSAQFTRIANDQAIPANFLIALPDETDAALEHYRAAISGFGDARLRLPPLHRRPERGIPLRWPRAEGVRAPDVGAEPDRAVEPDVATTGSLSLFFPTTPELLHSFHEREHEEGSIARFRDELGLPAIDANAGISASADLATVADESQNPSAPSGGEARVLDMEPRQSDMRVDSALAPDAALPGPTLDVPDAQHAGTESESLCRDDKPAEAPGEEHLLVLQAIQVPSSPPCDAPDEAARSSREIPLPQITLHAIEQPEGVVADELPRHAATPDPQPVIKPDAAALEDGMGETAAAFETDSAAAAVQATLAPAEERAPASSCLDDPAASPLLAGASIADSDGSDDIADDIAPEERAPASSSLDDPVAGHMPADASIADSGASVQTVDETVPQAIEGASVEAAVPAASDAAVDLARKPAASSMPTAGESKAPAALENDLNCAEADSRAASGAVIASDSALPASSADTLVANEPRLPNRRVKWISIAVLITLGAGTWGALRYSSQRVPAVPASATPPISAVQPSPTAESAARVAAPAAVSKLPKMLLITETGNSTDAQIAADLSRIVSAEAGVQLLTRSDVPFYWTDQNMPRLAITRYEALQSARRHPDVGARQRVDDLRVIAPLYTEEIYILVRRDSPLTYIHDIRNARMNLGPAGSTRDVTAARLYERIFGNPMPTVNASHLSDNEALRKMVVDRTLDAMIVVGAQPNRWLADLSPAVAQQIRPLRMDDRNALDQKAIDAYLPSVIRAANYRSWLSEDIPTFATMSFLVTSEPNDPAQAQRLTAFARSLCRSLAALRRDGHPKWREVQPSLEVDAGLPPASARAAFQSCASDRATGTAAVNP
jgi:TRAP-type uncharacterized transport system substrate-binding protein